jgi:tetratricopeptide (TPR) repeat protein
MQRLVTDSLGVREAYNELDAYGRSYGEEPLRLLLHAAVPQSFRADLLNLIKINFLDPRTGSDLCIDADVLLSPLVAANAAGYYRIDPQVRRHCLMLLESIYRDHRTVQVAHFLVAYIEHLNRVPLGARDPLLAEYLAIQRWVALAFTEPDAAAAAFAAALRQTLQLPATAARVRLGGITAAIEIPLSGHVELLAYAKGLDALRHGDAEAGGRILNALPDEEMVIGSILLPSPRLLLPTIVSPEEAVAVYRAVLEKKALDKGTLDRATAQNNLGLALEALGRRESGTTRLEEAVAAYRAALEERTRDRARLDWAATQNNLGLALATLGERESGMARLEEAVAAYRAALRERTR